jgi:hypothetical protein
MYTRIGSPILTAYTQHDYAQMLRRRNHPGDNDKALQLLTRALATAEQLGLRALAEKARPLKLTAEAYVFRGCRRLGGGSFCEFFGFRRAGMPAVLARDEGRDRPAVKAGVDRVV